MFDHKLIELESELVAKEQSKKGFDSLPFECVLLLDEMERRIEVRLAQLVPRDWRGWLSYRRGAEAMVVCRGRSFKEGMLGKTSAGLDVPNGLDAITDARRGFDVSPPQQLDHLLLNFGGDPDDASIFLWYGENIAAYKLIFLARISEEPETALYDQIVEACTWILKRPKEKTLTQFLKEEGL